MQLPAYSVLIGCAKKSFSLQINLNFIYSFTGLFWGFPFRVILPVVSVSSHTVFCSKTTCLSQSWKVFYLSPAQTYYFQFVHTATMVTYKRVTLWNHTGNMLTTNRSQVVTEDSSISRQDKIDLTCNLAICVANYTIEAHFTNGNVNT